MRYPVKVRSSRVNPVLVNPIKGMLDGSDIAITHLFKTDAGLCLTYQNSEGKTSTVEAGHVSILNEHEFLRLKLIASKKGIKLEKSP